MKKNSWVAAVIAIILVVFFSLYFGVLFLDTKTNIAWSKVQKNIILRNNGLMELLDIYEKHMKNKDTINETKIKINELKQILGSRDNVKKIQAMDNLDISIGKLLFESKKYVSLKSDPELRKILEELSDTEYDLYKSKINYNRSVSSYNQALSSGILSKIAILTGFRNEKPYFTRIPKD